MDEAQLKIEKLIPVYAKIYKKAIQRGEKTTKYRKKWDKT
jgi:hypothetical protein